MTDKSCYNCAFSDIDAFVFPCYLCDQTHNLFCAQKELIDFLIKLNVERYKKE